MDTPKTDASRDQAGDGKPQQLAGRMGLPEARRRIGSDLQRLFDSGAPREEAEECIRRFLEENVNDLAPGVNAAALEPVANSYWDPPGKASGPAARKATVVATRDPAPPPPLPHLDPTHDLVVHRGGNGNPAPVTQPEAKPATNVTPEPPALSPAAATVPETLQAQVPAGRMRAAAQEPEVQEELERSTAKPVAPAPEAPKPPAATVPEPPPTPATSDPERGLGAKIRKEVLNQRVKEAARDQVQRERPAPELTFTRASEVPEEKLDKLFGGRLLRGTFVPIVGPGEAGKGMTGCDLIARFTTGEAFPGDAQVRRTPAVVMVCTTEDSKGRTKARLRAAGADLTRVEFVEGPREVRGWLEVPSAVAFENDAGPLAQRAKEIGAQALFLETTLMHLGDREGKKRTDSNDQMSVRRALDPVLAVCREAGMFGFGALHPRKGSEGPVDESIGGSIAFRDVARMVLFIFRDPKDESVTPGRLLACNKANYLAFRPSTLRFRIDRWEKDADEGHVVWGIAAQNKLFDDRTIEEIWRQIRDRNKKERPRRDRQNQAAEVFLKGLLGGGMQPLERIRELADKEGHAWDIVKQAKVDLDIESVYSNTFPATVIGWRLPKDEAQGVIGDADGDM